jgi:hypothetical protein
VQLLTDYHPIDLESELIPMTLRQQACRWFWASADVLSNKQTFQKQQLRAFESKEVSHTKMQQVRAFESKEARHTNSCANRR